MATIPHNSEAAGLPLDSQGNSILPVDPASPSRVVHSLLIEGRVEEARAELERLVLEGIDSGPGTEATPEFWAELRAELHDGVLLKDE